MIIDDNQVMARRLAERLKSAASIKSVWCCGFDEKEINDCIEKMKPDIILLDMYDMEKIDQKRGVELARTKGAIWRNKGVVAIVLLTVIDSSETTEIGRTIKAALTDGTVDGYVRKPATSIEIHEAMCAAISQKREI